MLLLTSGRCDSSSVLMTYVRYGEIFEVSSGANEGTFSQNRPQKYAFLRCFVNYSHTL